MWCNTLNSTPTRFTFSKNIFILHYERKPFFIQWFRKWISILLGFWKANDVDADGKSVIEKLLNLCRWPYNNIIGGCMPLTQKWYKLTLVSILSLVIPFLNVLPRELLQNDKLLDVRVCLCVWIRGTLFINIDIVSTWTNVCSKQLGGN